MRLENAVPSGSFVRCHAWTLWCDTRLLEMPIVVDHHKSCWRSEASTTIDVAIVRDTWGQRALDKSLQFGHCRGGEANGRRLPACGYRWYCTCTPRATAFADDVVTHRYDVRTPLSATMRDGLPSSPPTFDSYISIVLSVYTPFSRIRWFQGIYMSFLISSQVSTVLSLEGLTRNDSG